MKRSRATTPRKLLAAAALLAVSALVTGAAFLPTPFQFSLPHFPGSEIKTATDISTEAESGLDFKKPLWADSIDNAYRNYRAISTSA